MKSIHNLENISFASPILADDILEFHAARLILLFNFCGSKGKIDGLTKMAKLDFFIRYPQFFQDYCIKNSILIKKIKVDIESSMIRYHYGPWDQRYYHVLAYLKSRGLLRYEKKGKTYILQLTDEGIKKAEELMLSDSFKDLIDQIKLVNSIFGKKSGTQLKTLVYESFDQEIVKLKRGERIV